MNFSKPFLKKQFVKFGVNYKGKLGIPYMQLLMSSQIYLYKRNAWQLPGVINHYAKAKILHHVYCAFSEGKLRKLYTKDTE